jgi:hypothetical protein
VELSEVLSKWRLRGLVTFDEQKKMLTFPAVSWTPPPAT